MYCSPLGVAEVTTSGEAGWVDIPARQSIGLFHTDETVGYLLQQSADSALAACPSSPPIIASPPLITSDGVVLSDCPQDFHAAFALQLSGFLFLFIGSALTAILLYEKEDLFLKYVWICGRDKVRIQRRVAQVI